MKALRSWMDSASIAVDASACEVVATATDDGGGAATAVAAKVTEGRSKSLPARGPAFAVISELRYSDAMRFNVVMPALGGEQTSPLF